MTGQLSILFITLTNTNLHKIKNDVVAIATTSFFILNVLRLLLHSEFADYEYNLYKSPPTYEL